MKKIITPLVVVIAVLGSYLYADQPTVGDSITHHSSSDSSDFYVASQCIDGGQVYKNYNYYVGDTFKAIDYHYGSHDVYSFVFDRASSVTTIDPYGVMGLSSPFAYISNGKAIGVKQVYFVNTSGQVNDGSLLSSRPSKPRFQIVYNLHRRRYHHGYAGNGSATIGYVPYPNGSFATKSFSGIYPGDMKTNGYECFNYYVHYCGDGKIDTASSIASMEGGNKNSVANEQCDKGDQNGKPGSGCSATCQKVEEVPAPVCSKTYHNHTHYIKDQLADNAGDLCSSGTLKQGSLTRDGGTYNWTCINTDNKEALCSATVQRCGDGTRQENHEQCDKGDQNGKPGSGCSAECKKVAPSCGEHKNKMYYGKNRRFTASTVGLCSSGSVDGLTGPSASGGYFWDCVNGAEKDSCSATVHRCGDGDRQDNKTYDNNVTAREQCDEGSQNGAADATCSSTCQDQTPATPDLRIRKEASVDQGGSSEGVLNGAEVTFTIKFKNEGAGTATDVTITDNVPSGYKVTDVEMEDYNGSKSLTRDGNNIKYTGLTLSHNQGGTIIIKATVDDEHCDKMINTVTIQGSQTQEVSSRTVLTCASSLNLQKEQKGGDSRDFTSRGIKVKAKDIISYRITATNHGARAKSLSIVDRLPSGVEYDGGSLDFRVDGSTKSNLCDVSSRTIRCGDFELGHGKKAVLEFDVQVATSVDDRDHMRNTATLQRGGNRQTKSDSVSATVNMPSPSGDITKTLENRGTLKVGETSRFDITFENTGETDLVRYTITDTWPAEKIGLVCDDKVYSTHDKHSQNMRNLQTCLDRNLEITIDRADSRRTRTVTPKAIEVRWRGYSTIEIRITFDEDDNSRHRLEPGDEVAFSLKVKAIKPTNATNKASVVFYDENGNSGDDSGWDGDADVEVKGGYRCQTPDIGETTVSGNNIVSKEVACKTKDRHSVDKMILDCGYSDGRITHRDRSNISGICKYKKNGNYTVTCQIEDVAAESGYTTCKQNIHISQIDERGTPICGDGIKDYYEQCDFGNIGIAQTLSSNGWYLDARRTRPWTGTRHPGLYCTTTCRLVDLGGVRPDPGPNPKPKPGGHTPKLPNCLMIDSAEKIGGKPVPMSIMRDEVLPFWWAIEDDKTRYTDTCDKGDVGKLVKSTMKCDFEISHKGRIIKTLKHKNCHDIQQLYNGSLDSLAVFGKDGSQSLDIDKHIDFGNLNDAKNTKGLGEYEIKLSKFTYDVCEKDGDKVVSKSRTSEECCMVNFTVTKPYIIQEGLGATKDFNKALYGTINPLIKYFKIDGKNFADAYKIPYKEIKASDYDGGTAVTNAVNKFVKKYSALAIGKSNAHYKKVPGKNIIIYTGKGTINAGDVNTSKPFTVIVDSKDAVVNLNKNITQHAMYVIKSGTLKISKDAKVVNGIFVLDKKAKLVSDKMRNDDTSKDWIVDGGLTINGVIVGGDKSVEGLMKSRRSTLRGWFYKSDKQKMFEAGASLRIRNNPSLWMTPPPGVDELDSVFAVYKN